MREDRLQGRSLSKVTETELMVVLEREARASDERPTLVAFPGLVEGSGRMDRRLPVGERLEITRRNIGEGFRGQESVEMIRHGEWENGVWTRSGACYHQGNMTEGVAGGGRRDWATRAWRWTLLRSWT